MSEEMSLAVIGDNGTGKTCLVVQFCQSFLPDDEVLNDPWLDDTYRKQVLVDEISETLEIYDSVFEPEMPHYADTVYKQSEGFLMVYSTTDRDSFDFMKNEYESISNAKDSDNVPTVLVGTKCDWEHLRQVAFDEGEQLAKRWGCPFFETSSALRRTNVDECFYELVREVRIARKPPLVKVRNHIFGFSFGNSYYIPMPKRPTSKLLPKLVVPSKFPLMRQTELNMLYKSSCYDTTVHCSDGIDLMTHRCILRQASAVFALLIDNEEKGIPEQLVLNVQDSSLVMKHVLEYIYTRENSQLRYKECIDFHLDSVAARYGLDGLWSRCNTLLKKGNELKAEESPKKSEELKIRKSRPIDDDIHMQLHTRASINYLESPQKRTTLDSFLIDLWPTVKTLTDKDYVNKSISRRDCDLCLVANDGKEIYVHKAVIVERSSVLSAMLNREHGFKEAEKTRINVSDVEFDSLIDFCQYLYTFNDLVVNSHNVFDLLYLSDFYGIDDRLNISCQRLLCTSMKNGEIDYRAALPWALMTRSDELLRQISLWIAFTHSCVLNVMEGEVAADVRERRRQWLSEQIDHQITNDFMDILEAAILEYNQLCQFLETKAKKYLSGRRAIYDNDDCKLHCCRNTSNRMKPLPLRLPFFQTIVDDWGDLHAERFFPE